MVSLRVFMTEANIFIHRAVLSYGEGRGGAGPPNNFDSHVQRPRSSGCSSVQRVHFGSIKRENDIFMASVILVTYKKREINALGRLKMLFQRPYISKTLGVACLRTPVAARAFGARDYPPQ